MDPGIGAARTGITSIVQLTARTMRSNTYFFVILIPDEMRIFSSSATDRSFIAVPLSVEKIFTSYLCTRSVLKSKALNDGIFYVIPEY